MNQEEHSVEQVNTDVFKIPSDIYRKAREQNTKMVRPVEKDPRLEIDCGKNHCSIHLPTDKNWI